MGVLRICTMWSLFSLLAVLLLSACAASASPGDGQSSTPAAANAVVPKPGVSPTPGPVSTKGPAQSKTSGTRIDACAILTLKDAEEFLGAKAKITSRLEPGSSKSYETRCSYRTEMTPDRGFGLYMQVDEKPANAEIGFDTRVSMATKKTEAIPDLGDKAVYALEGVPGAGRAGVIYVLKSSVFFWITPTVGELTQEDAVKLAQKGLGRLP